MRSLARQAASSYLLSVFGSVCVRGYMRLGFGVYMCKITVILRSRQLARPLIPNAVGVSHWIPKDGVPKDLLPWKEVKLNHRGGNLKRISADRLSPVFVGLQRVRVGVAPAEIRPPEARRAAT